MFGIDSVVWGVIVVSTVSNFIFDVLFEVPLEYGVKYLREKQAEQAGEGLASAEKLDVTWVQQLADGVNTMPHNWEMLLHEIESVGRLVAPLVL
jgi:hypothetical protein